MIIWWILLSFQLKEVPTSPQHLYSTLPKVDQHGNVVYLGRKELFHWHKDGLRTLSVDFDAHFFFFNGIYYWVVGASKSSFFDASGQFIGNHETLGETWEVQSTNSNNPIVNFRMSSEGLRRNQVYPPQASLVEVTFLKSIEVKPILDFSKATARMNELSMTFTNLWITQQNQTYYVVDQIEPKVRRYNARDIRRERGLGWRKPDHEVVAEPLLLEKYQGMPEKYLDNIKGAVSMEEGTQLVNEWWDSCALIVFFGRFDERRHIIAYRIPQVKNGKAMGFRLGVQILGPAPYFKPVGALLEIQEIQSHQRIESVYHLAGVHERTVVVFYPNVTPTGGMKPTLKYFRYSAGQWRESS